MTIKQSTILISRIALFIIYFWFGFLKVIGQSPASPMLHSLLSHTMPFIPFSIFIIFFGLFEMLIGALFVVPGAERYAIILFCLHMVTVALALFILREEIWTGIFAPTLEGQYIIKNLALIACVLTVWSSIDSQRERNNAII